MELVKVSEKSRSELNNILLDFKSSLRSIAFYTMKVFRDGGIGSKIYSKLEHVGLRYTPPLNSDPQTSSYKYLSSIPMTATFRAEINETSYNTGRMITTSDITFKPSDGYGLVEVWEEELGIPLAYLEPNQQLHIQLGARVGRGSDHARWKPFLYGAIHDKDTFLQYGSKSRSGEDVGEKRVYLIGKGNVDLDELWDWVSEGNTVDDNVFKSFFQVMGGSLFPKLITSFYPNTEGLFSVLDKCVIPDVNVKDVINPETFVTKTLKAMLLTTRVLLINLGYNPSDFPLSGDSINEKNTETKQGFTASSGDMFETAKAINTDINNLPVDIYLQNVLSLFCGVCRLRDHEYGELPDYEGIIAEVRSFFSVERGDYIADPMASLIALDRVFLSSLEKMDIESTEEVDNGKVDISFSMRDVYFNLYQGVALIRVGTGI